MNLSCAPAKRSGRSRRDGPGRGRAVRVGGHSGPCVISDVSTSGRQESLARGETLNVAAYRLHVDRALRPARGRVEGPFGAARTLGLNAHTLRGRVRKLQIDWRRFRPQ